MSRCTSLHNRYQYHRPTNETISWNHIQGPLLLLYKESLSSLRTKKPSFLHFQFFFGHSREYPQACKPSTFTRDFPEMPMSILKKDSECEASTRQLCVKSLTRVKHIQNVPFKRFLENILSKYSKIFLGQLIDFELFYVATVQCNVYLQPFNMLIQKSYNAIINVCYWETYRKIH